MRYRLPDECAGVTLGGVTLVKAADGTVEAAVESAADLAPHGIVPIEDEPQSSDGSGRKRAVRT